MDKLQILIDIEEIKNLKHRYFRAIDMADFDLLDHVFADNISIDYPNNEAYRKFLDCFTKSSWIYPGQIYKDISFFGSSDSRNKS